MELKEICKERGLPKWGTKEKFVKRILKNQKEKEPNIEKKKFLYGSQSFNKIYKTPNSWFVDKTGYIKVLENLDMDAILSLRPRRFGKSLWIDTLANYYDIKK